MSGANGWRGAHVYTIGHSTRTLDELVALLRAFDVSVVADIRTIPRSRRNPQFDRNALRSSLRARRIRYVHLPDLGGLRRSRAGSPNTAWRNASFRGYADYMLTPRFEAGLEELRTLAGSGTVALMCAEAVPWRCHRSLVADALSARGARVEHIMSTKRAAPHRMTPFPRVDGSRVTYSGGGEEQLHTRAPFHLEATVRVLQRRPSNRVDVWEDERYLRVLHTAGGVALVAVTNRGSIDAPDVRFEVLHGDASADARAELARSLRRLLGLDLDPAPLQRLAEAERRLAPTARALRGMRPPRFAGLFEAFANVVPFQQVSLDAGVAIVGRLVERFGDAIEHEGRRRQAFPRAGVVAGAPLEALRACGLSARKADTLQRVGAAIESGALSEDELSRASSVDAMRALRELPGIGPWSAALVLLRGLGRLDVFPPGDVGVQRGLEHLLRLPRGRSAAAVVRRFGEHCGYLYFCSLGGALLERGLVHAAPPTTERAAREGSSRRAPRGKFHTR